MTGRRANVRAARSPKAEEILRHATELLAVGGYNAFSYADIAERVGISKPSIHHHFPSKAALVASVIARYREDARAGLSMLSEGVGEPSARLQAYCGYWADCIDTAAAPICICALLAAEFPSIPDEVAAEVTAHFETLQAWLADTLETGRAQASLHFAGSAETEAQAFMATVHGAMLASRAFGDHAMFQAIARQALDRLGASSSHVPGG